MSQAFISYHRGASKLARLLAHRIAAEGYSVWWDRGERPGDRWNAAVTAALSASNAVLVLWTKRSVESPLILGEATAGFARGVLISVLAEPCRIPVPFDEAPTIDLTDWDGEREDLPFKRLIEQVARLLGTAALPGDAPHQSRTLVRPTMKPPLRFAETSAPAPAPYPAEENARTSALLGVLAVLLAGGVGYAWIERDRFEPMLQEALGPRFPSEDAAKETPAAAPELDWRAPSLRDESPALRETSEPDAVAPEPPKEAALDAATVPEASVSPTPVSAPAAKKSEPPAKRRDTAAERPDDWVPPPTLRTLPAATPAPVSRAQTSPSPSAARPQTPAPTPAQENLDDPAPFPGE